jgi:1,4-alpha-glucan branching enzyme
MRVVSIDLLCSVHCWEPPLASFMPKAADEKFSVAYDLLLTRSGRQISHKLPFIFGVSMSTAVMTDDVNAMTDNLPLGCSKCDQGFAFKVWAPHATAVSVIGDFNDWNCDSHPCQRDDHGNWSVEIPEAEAGAGYKFHIVNGDKTFDRIDPRARQVTSSVGHSIVTVDDFDWEDDSFQCPPWNELVIYEMHVGTFNTQKGVVGDFESCIAKLDYLRDLGVNAVELMPLAEFAGDYSWGYNPAHPFAIETAYGGINGLKKFILEAHKRGIAVIVDVVYNHFGPSDLDIWQFDGWSENNKGGIYFYNDDRSATPWGDTRPDYGRQEVRQYIFDNAMMWLEEFHADGLRYDMTLYIRARDHDQNNLIEEGFSLLQWVNAEVAAKYPGRITIAEDLQNNPRLTEDTVHGGGGFDAQWDAGFVHPVRGVITAISDADRSMAVVTDAIQHKYNHDVFERVIYTESHDEVANGKQRVVSEIDPSETPNRYAIKRSTLGACLMMTAPGVPMLFQGQEFLREGWFEDTNPLDWQRAEQYKGIVGMYRDLIKLRRNKDGLSSGLLGQFVHVYHVNDTDKILAMRRWKEADGHDDVIVVFKFSENRAEDYKIGLPSDGRWKLVFNSDAEVYHSDMDGTELGSCEATDEAYDGYPFSTTVNIGAYSCLIFAREKK